MRFSIFSGTNTWAECRQALRALAGGAPLQDGPAIEDYERAFARAAGVRHAFSLAAGRMALYRLLEALDIGPGDEVLLPAFTCVVVPNAVIYRGARPVYVDIQPRTFNIDPALIESKITPRTRAVIAQHTFGRICDMDAILEIAKRRGLDVLEDCAHALGAERGGRKAGSLSKAAYFSTDHSKVVSTSTGGMIATDDPALAARLRALQEKTPFLPASRVRRILATFILEFALLDPRIFRLGFWLRKIPAKLGLWAYFGDELSLTKPESYPARLSNAQALIGLSQLRLLESNLSRRRELAALYHRRLAEAGVAVDGAQEAYLRYTFLVESRPAWIELFRGVLDMCPWFTSVAHGRDRELDKIGYAPGSCPAAETAARHCVNLPTHPRISRPELLEGSLRRALQDRTGRLRLLRLDDPLPARKRPMLQEQENKPS